MAPSRPPRTPSAGSHLAAGSPRRDRPPRQLPTRRLAALAVLAVAVLAVAVLGAGCTQQSAAPPATTAAPATTGTRPPDPGDAADLGVTSWRKVLPDVKIGEATETDCIGAALGRDPTLRAVADKSLAELEIDVRKRVIRVYADCIGPDGLVLVYLAGQSAPVDDQTRDCLHQQLVNRPLDQAVAVVAGEGDAAEKFRRQVAALCTPSTTGSTPGTAPGATPGTVNGEAAVGDTDRPAV